MASTAGSQTDEDDATIIADSESETSNVTASPFILSGLSLLNKRRQGTPRSCMGKAFLRRDSFESPVFPVIKKKLKLDQEAKPLFLPVEEIVQKHVDLEANMSEDTNDEASQGSSVLIPLVDPSWIPQGPTFTSTDVTMPASTGDTENRDEKTLNKLVKNESSQQGSQSIFEDHQYAIVPCDRRLSFGRAVLAGSDVVSDSDNSNKIDESQSQSQWTGVHIPDIFQTEDIGTEYDSVGSGVGFDRSQQGDVVDDQVVEMVPQSWASTPYDLNLGESTLTTKGLKTEDIPDGLESRTPSVASEATVSAQNSQVSCAKQFRIANKSDMDHQADFFRKSSQTTSGTEEDEGEDNLEPSQSLLTQAAVVVSDQKLDMKAAASPQASRTDSFSESESKSSSVNSQRTSASSATVTQAEIKFNKRHEQEMAVLTRVEKQLCKADSLVDLENTETLKKTLSTLEPFLRRLNQTHSQERETITKGLGKKGLTKIEKSNFNQQAGLLRSRQKRLVLLFQQHQRLSNIVKDGETAKTKGRPKRAKLKGVRKNLKKVEKAKETKRPETKRPEPKPMVVAPDKATSASTACVPTCQKGTSAQPIFVSSKSAKPGFHAPFKHPTQSVITVQPNKSSAISSGGTNPSPSSQPSQNEVPTNALLPGVYQVTPAGLVKFCQGQQVVQMAVPNSATNASQNTLKKCLETPVKPPARVVILSQTPKHIASKESSGKLHVQVGSQRTTEGVVPACTQTGTKRPLEPQQSQPDLKELIEAGVIAPGENVLSIHTPKSTVFASLLDDGRIRSSDRTYGTLFDWCLSSTSAPIMEGSALYKKVLYKGKPLLDLSLARPIKTRKADAIINLGSSTPRRIKTSTKPGLSAGQNQTPIKAQRSAKVTPKPADDFDLSKLLKQCSINLIDSTELQPSDSFLPRNFWSAPSFNDVRIPRALTSCVDRW